FWGLWGGWGWWVVGSLGGGLWSGCVCWWLFGWGWGGWFWWFWAGCGVVGCVGFVAFGFCVALLLVMFFCFSRSSSLVVS
ncbi:hypothetical protein RA279_28370, partial [Pseudomonas syringae pv. tagetis]|uniref:hypothetical protein n=1 Tax=Pseudomonas syringae group genomosp. 7 TaxID=251699 RepID=UPI00376F6A8D